MYNLHEPQSFYPNSQTAWRYLNRTLYRGKDCTDRERHWLRNDSSDRSEHQNEMMEKYNYIAYPDDLFYKTHRISLENLLEEL